MIRASLNFLSRPVRRGEHGRPQRGAGGGQLPPLDFGSRCISESTFSQQLPAAVSAGESSVAAADECAVASVHTDHLRAAAD